MFRELQRGNLFYLVLLSVFVSCSPDNDIEEYLLQIKENDYIHSLRASNDGTILKIANSLMNDNLPGNTQEHYLEAIKYGFNALKADAQLTKDGAIVLCHDNGYTLNESNRIVKYNKDNYIRISELNLEEIKQLEFEVGHKLLGYYCHPIELSSFLYLCVHNNVIPYITIRNDNPSETASVVIKELKRYNLIKKAIINNYPPSQNTCKIIRDIDPYISISYTIGKNTPCDVELIDVVSSLGNAFLCVQKDNLLEAPALFWDEAQSKDIRIYSCEVKDFQDYNELVKKGCAGFQISNIFIFESN